MFTIKEKFETLFHSKIGTIKQQNLTLEFLYYLLYVHCKK
jgi:hypothetical protein